MMRLGRILASGLVCSTLIGCAWLLEDESGLFLKDANDERAVFVHFDEYSGWVTLPSTIWTLDLGTEKVRRVLDARRQYDVQIEGDFYAAELPTDDDQGSRIVARRISTGEQFTILERDVQLGGRYDRAFVLDGDRIVARTDEGLLVYDLENREVATTIPVEDHLAVIHEVGGHWALVVRDDVHSGDELLVNLENGQVLEIPPVSDDVHAFFPDAVVSDTWLIMSGFAISNDTITDHHVLLFDIPSQTWETLVAVEFEPSEPPVWPLVFVRGATDAHVLITSGSSLVEMRLELLDRSSGQRAVLERRFGLAASPFGMLRGERVYWVDVAEETLISYDIATQQRTSHPFTIPLAK
jgi:hypothetical protein